MSAVLDLPPIDADMIDKPARPVATIEPATLKQTVIASFSPIRAMCATLAERYRDVAFDLKTPKGMEQAKAARLELREAGRYPVQRLQDQLKKEANDLKKTVDAEAAAALEPIKPVEDAIHSSIVAREEEIEAEREKARKAEADRLAAIALAEQQAKALREAEIARIRGYLTYCQQPSMTAARIQQGVDIVAKFAFGDDDADYRRAQDETLAGMRALHALAVAQEAEAARLEALRVELERQRAEQAERDRLAKIESDRIAAEQAAAAAALAEAQRKLDEQAAALKLQAEELAAQQAAEVQRKADEAAAAEAERVRVERSGTNPETGDHWRLTDPQIQAELQADLDEMKADPAKAVSFLQDMGVLDAGGKLAPEYGGEPAPDILINGLTEAETAASVSCAGLTAEPQTSVDISEWVEQVNAEVIDVDRLLEDCRELIATLLEMVDWVATDPGRKDAERLLALLE